MIEVATHGQAAMPAVGAGGDSTVSLVGVTRGPNILGTTSPIVADGVTAYNGTVFGANTNLGTTAGVYGDTGIFYSTDPATAFGTYTGGEITNNSGDDGGRTHRPGHAHEQVGCLADGRVMASMARPTHLSHLRPSSTATVAATRPGALPMRWPARRAAMPGSSILEATSL